MCYYLSPDTSTSSPVQAVALGLHFPYSCVNLTPHPQLPEGMGRLKFHCPRRLLPQICARTEDAPLLMDHELTCTCLDAPCARLHRLFRSSGHWALSPASLSTSLTKPLRPVSSPKNHWRTPCKETPHQQETPALKISLFWSKVFTSLIFPTILGCLESLLAGLGFNKTDSL